ncbi:hypothetical protein [Flavobacterium hibisci]|uniref:hypothetical protein n=1 Tax=Flavobacterium hibisci TaxID=1914462 RepID=UPI001CBA6F3B|nr:hypothetical protein [Flavobacterium hibisci]MBZ4042494.1 hypothetical protein [Flavobacterium hibisci]
MKSKQILFFATANDIIEIVKALEEALDVKYYEMGLFDKKNSTCYNSVSEIPNFGISKYGDWNKDLRLIMLSKSTTLIVREIPQRKGGVKYAIDALENQSSICFQFGGIYENEVLIAGTCGTSFLNNFSETVFKEFSSKVKKSFTKIEDFYVGKEAEEKLRSGWRLVTNEKLSKEFDLKIKTK